MPNPAAVELIASQLHELTADDGTILRNAQLAPSKAMPQTWHDEVTKHRLGQAQGIVNLIEAAGGTVTMPGDGPAPETPPAQWVDVNCTTCGNRLMRVNLIRPNVSGTNLISAMHNLDPACPHHPEAERQ
jgi:hypothetical protein